MIKLSWDLNYTINENDDLDLFKLSKWSDDNDDIYFYATSADKDLLQSFSKKPLKFQFYKEANYLTITNKDDIESLKSKDFWDYPNEDKFNAIIIRAINHLAPAGYELKSQDEQTTFGWDDAPVTIFKYDLYIANKKSTFDKIFLEPIYNDNTGLIELDSVFRIINSFKTSEFQNQLKDELDYVHNIQTNEILNNPNYAITANYYTWYDEYFFNKDETIIDHTHGVVDATFEPINYMTLRRNYELTIVDKTKSNNEVTTFTCATIRQILRNQLPAFKTILNHDKEVIKNDKIYQDIATLSCKINHKIYYLHEFNQNFPDFKIRFVGDIDYDISFDKIPKDYLEFAKKIHNIVWDEFHKVFGNFWSGTIKNYFFTAYIPFFAKVYCYTFHKNDDLSDIKNTIKYIFNNIYQHLSNKERSSN